MTPDAMTEAVLRQRLADVEMRVRSNVRVLRQVADACADSEADMHSAVAANLRMLSGTLRMLADAFDDDLNRWTGTQ